MNRNDVYILVSEAVELGLFGSDDVAFHPIECLSTDYNGIGPECFHEKLRNALDSLADELRPACLIHDFRWSHSDGSLDEFRASNTELEMNCRKIAKSHPWYSFRRYYLLLTGISFSRLCSQFGLLPYLSAFYKSKERQ